MDTVNTDGRERLKFFGRVTASATHDLKNVLAIVNENAGLLEDLCLLAERGQLTPDRLTHASGRIREQVNRGNGIIRRLNDFAHTPDVDETNVDLAEAALLAAGLSARFAQLRETSIETDTASTATVRGSKFEVVRLACGLLEIAADAAKTAGPVSIRSTAAPTALEIAAPEGVSFDGSALAPLAESAGASLDSSAPHHVAIVFGDA
ncbi:ATP-binding protein [Salidesulfovibrio brasiliensis]|uniref:HAMP domain-containing histidine kinase n=1 Tax=Salidesulfovibrio brasiliensis TaxID=221711 RepID=UPI0006D0B160|nr:HAMP domain-containing histidine kinase [Salidesulfovibrio brasiliensis]